ncbi:hypothetical protein BGZ58_000878 [Dissophora ornata]|nr:hypothetical protein BGZ58_000878 [Dissophora ornata]
MILIINGRRSYLDGTDQGLNGLSTGFMADIFRGSANKQMFEHGVYGFVFYGFLVGAVIPIILQRLLKKFHNVKQYVLILSDALDTGAAFTGLLIFLSLGGRLSPTLSVQIPVNGEAIIRMRRMRFARTCRIWRWTSVEQKTVSGPMGNSRRCVSWFLDRGV